MDTDLTLTGVDTDGAIQETAERAGVNRADLLKRGAIGGGALFGAASLLGAIPGAAFASSKGSVRASSDVDILNFALTLEYLESAFYAEALMKGALKGPTAAFAKVVAKDEAQHVAFLKSALGAKAVAKPTFDFKGTTAAMGAFQKTAMALEDTGVSAYAGAAPLISEQEDPLGRPLGALRRGPARRLDPQHHGHQPGARAVRRRQDQGTGSQDRHGHRLHHRLARSSSGTVELGEILLVELDCDGPEQLG